VIRAQSVSSTALYSIAYSSNIYFAKVINYFDLSARENPLLHLWSLGVEEQFYLIVPLGIWCLWLAKKNFLLQNLVLLCAASFLCGQFALSSGNSSFAFYMLPGRAWELLAGSILSQLPRAKCGRPVFSAAFGWIGLLLVLIPYMFLNDKVAFPGLAAVPSVLGASLLIRYGSSGPTGKLLSLAPSVGVGKISYSLYLWHWPLFVFMAANHSLEKAVGCLVATFAAAWLSWRYVETPVRRYKAFDARHAFGALVVCSLVLTAACMFLNHTRSRNGSLAMQWGTTDTWGKWELAHDPRRSRCRLEDMMSRKSDLLISIGRKNVQPAFVLWGDSHALALLPGVDAVASEWGRAGLYINLKHDFTLDQDLGGGLYNPRQDREPIIRWLEETREIRDVFLVSSWFSHLRNDEDVNEAARMCERLKLSKKQVFVFLTVPDTDGQTLRRFDWGLKVDWRINSTPAQVYNARAKLQSVLVQRIQERSLAKVIPLNMAFWNGSVYCAGSETESFYVNETHVNGRGAVHAMRFVAPMIWDGDTATGHVDTVDARSHFRSAKAVE
jgi:hypothetical protein